jgi:membrane protein implicated in regulation of membrane protease activity
MQPGIGTIFLALLSFAATFALARWLGRGFRERRAKRAKEEALKGQSRQVRRARQRKDAGRNA